MIQRASCPPMIARRALLLTAGAAALAGASRASDVIADPAAALAAIETGVGGRIGVAALDTGSGRRLSHRGGERFAMCSTFRLMLAALVLERVDGGELKLDQSIAYGPADLLRYAPVTRAHVADGGMRLDGLCAAAVEQSDNTAANLLLRLIGGPAGYTAGLRRLGDAATRLDRYETSLNTNLPGDPRDTSTPDAMVSTLRKALLGGVLAPTGAARLIGWMKACATGADRLRAGLPRDWTAGDKTGTGDNGAVNDLAITWPPGRKPILIVAYMSGSSQPLEALNAAQKQIGAIIASTFA